MIRAKWRVGEADQPVDFVAAEESQVDPAVPGGGGGLAHRGGPVLVVAEGEHGARATLPQARAHCRDIAKPSVMSFHQKAITSIDPTTRKVSTDQGHYQADVLAVALGADRSTSRGGAGG